MDDSSVVRRLIGVYDADGSVAGELSYFLRARIGRAHCALCDITHGRIRERADWRACRDRMPVPFMMFHRDDQPDELRRAGGGALPVVLAETDDDRLVLLVGPEGLEDCHGSPATLADRVHAAAGAQGLRWPAR